MSSLFPHNFCFVCLREIEYNQIALEKRHIEKKHIEVNKQPPDLIQLRFQ